MTTHAIKRPQQPAGNRADLCTALQHEINATIPLTRAMQLRVTGCTTDGLMLDAPLQPNINDKGTAFGGSLSAMLTVAGWGLLWLRTREAGVHCEVMIARGEISFRRPLQDDLRACCPEPAAAEWSNFINQLRLRGKARITLAPKILDALGQETVTFRSEYVALMRDPT